MFPTNNKSKFKYKINKQIDNKIHNHYGKLHNYYKKLYNKLKLRYSQNNLLALNIINKLNNQLNNN